MFLATLEPKVPMGGESLYVILCGFLFSFFLLVIASKFTLNALRIIASYASLTVLVFLRKEMGVRTLSAMNLLIALLFLYFIGNMVGHNYHDMYRNVGATAWGAKIHFTYLEFFIMMGAYRKVEAWQQEKTMKPSSLGTPSAFAQRLPTHSRLTPQGEFYTAVVREPLAVISVGFLLSLLLHNWFGWYLILTGCLMFYWLLWSYYEQREAHLDTLEQPNKESTNT